MTTKTPFSLDSNDIFITSVDGKIKVWKNAKLHEPFLEVSDWKYQKTLNPNDGDEIELFGTVVRGFELQQLVQDLRVSTWSVNREGYNYIYVSKYGHLRVNDLFDWSKYGVNVTRETIWNRFEMNSKNVVVDLVELNRLLVEYREKVVVKEKELISCREQLVEKDNLISKFEQKLEEKERELTSCKRQLKEKDELLAYYKLRLEEKEEELLSCNRRIDELEVKVVVFAKDLEVKVNELSDLNVCLAKKEEELEATHNQLSRTEKSLQEKCEELEVAKTELSSCQKRLQQKDDEIADLNVRLEEKDEEIRFAKQELARALMRFQEKLNEMKRLAIFLGILIVVLLIVNFVRGKTC